MPDKLKKRKVCFSQTVDLSHPIEPGMPYWPGDPPTRFEIEARLDREGYFLRSFLMSEHAGTHLNAPSCFDPLGLSVDQIPFSRLILPGFVVDVRRQSAKNHDYTLTTRALLNWERANGRIPEGCLVILRTGWDSRWSKPEAFLNADAHGLLHFPGFSPEAARLLLEERGAAALGTDTHGVDPGLDDSFSVSRLAAQRGRLVVENLANLGRIPVRGFTVILGILRLRGGSGSPVSAIAILP